MATELDAIVAAAMRERASTAKDRAIAMAAVPQRRPAFARMKELIESAGLKHIRLIAPTTPEHRIALIASQSEGFIYYVSREGVTGAQTETLTTAFGQIVVDSGLQASASAHDSLPGQGSATSARFGVSSFA